MKSYQYLIELLIAGAGAFVWIIIFSIDVFGVDWFYFEYQMLQQMSDGILFALLFLLFPFLFVAGIITDRVSDYVLDKVYNIHEAKKYFKDKTDYHRTKALIFMSSTDLRDLYEYGRMRSRICRDWSLNSILILIASNYLIWNGSLVETGRLKISIFITTLLLASTVISFLTWRNLIKKEYRFICMSKELLLKDKENKVQDS